MSDYMPSNSKIDKAVVDATTGPNASYETMRAALRSSLQAEGVIAPSRDGDLGAQMLPNQRTQAAPMPAATMRADIERQKCFRVIYPSGNTRVELWGLNEADLDMQEARIRRNF